MKLLQHQVERQLKAATGSLSCLEGEGEGEGSSAATCNFTTRGHSILHSEPLGMISLYCISIVWKFASITFSYAVHGYSWPGSRVSFLSLTMCAAWSSQTRTWRLFRLFVFLLDFFIFSLGDIHLYLSSARPPSPFIFGLLSESSPPERKTEVEGMKSIPVWKQLWWRTEGGGGHTVHCRAPELTPRDRVRWLTEFSAAVNDKCQSGIDWEWWMLDRIESVTGQMIIR